MAKKNIQSLKGFRDYYPDDMAFQKWFYENASKVSKLFGYQEYEGPTLEPLDLYAAKSGEELVKKQAFTFTDKGERVVALRPEMTPSLARMVAQKSADLTFPLRWFTVGKRFRYEQPQAGRGREFTQWDIDILGTDSPLADAEIITIAANLYKQIEVSPSEVRIKINDRKFLLQNLKKIGVPDKTSLGVLKVIDKKNKVGADTYTKLLTESGLKVPQIKKLNEFLKDKEAYKKSERLTSLLGYLEKFGVSDYIEYDPQIVRGLDYYTSTVFEGWDVKGKFRSLWGGGRYDNLTADIGSKSKIPGVGFAMGDMVLKEVLKEYKKMPSFSAVSSKVLITIFSPKQLDISLKTLNNLQNANINCEIYPDPEVKLQKQLKYADRKGIPWVIIIGPEEILKDSAVLKNMKSKKQETVPSQALLTRIK